jgi:hypothetical protein
VTRLNASRTAVNAGRSAAEARACSLWGQAELPPLAEMIEPIRPQRMIAFWISAAAERVPADATFLEGAAEPSLILMVWNSRHKWMCRQSIGRKHIHGREVSFWLFLPSPPP